jgi:predicted SnoaL-like aldol condensation-catalyzing enzyme
MLRGAGRRIVVQTLETNKRIVKEFYEAVVNRKDFDAARGYLGGSYIQHNPLVGDGRDGLRDFIDFLKAEYPRARSEVRRCLAEGDLVVLHVHSVRTPETPGRAIVDIFRLERGRIVEHWDVIQEVPPTAANGNGMF